VWLALTPRWPALGSNEDVHLEVNEFCGKARKPIAVSFRRPEFQPQVPALRISKVAQAVTQHGAEWLGILEVQNADRDRLRLLRAQG
jgi:hypothetical protein